MLNCTCTGSVHRPTDRYLNRCICMFGVQSPTVSTINYTTRTSPLVLKPDPSVIWERETLPTAFHFLHNTLTSHLPFLSNWCNVDFEIIGRRCGLSNDVKISSEGAVSQPNSRLNLTTIEWFPHLFFRHWLQPTSGSVDLRRIWSLQVADWPRQRLYSP